MTFEVKPFFVNMRQRPLSHSVRRQATPKPVLAKPVRASSPGSLLQLRPIVGNQALGKFLQAKLSISQPGDHFEQEADRVADRVMRMDEHGKEVDHVDNSPQLIQRACSKCEDEKEKHPESVSDLDERHVQTKRVNGQAQSSRSIENTTSALAGRGDPLPDSALNFFEPRFGHDFSHIRIHTDTQAAESARSINALAYTFGNNVVFAAGQYSPFTQPGRELLAHELTHTVQQGSVDRVARKGEKKTSDPVSLITLDRTARTVVIQTSGGVQYRGSAVTDLEPGTYTAKAQPRVQKWVFKEGQGVKPGQRFWVDLQKTVTAEGQVEEGAPDPWGLSYSDDVTIVVGGATPEPVYMGPSVQERMDKLTELINNKWTDDKDELAIIQLIAEAPQEQAAELLEKLSTTKIGDETYLEALDRVVDFTNNQHLHEALSLLRMKTTDPAKAALDKAPVLPWHDVMGFFEDNATFTVERTPKGKYRLRYLGGTRLINSTDFRSEVKELPLNVFLGGMEFEPGQVIIVHDYDTGHFVPLTVEQLAGYEHAGVRNFLGHVATVASLAMPVSAARTVAGKAAVLAIERVLPVITLVIDENRLNIMKWFPNWGPKILKFSDLAKVGMAAYGIVRFALTSYQLVKNWKSIVGMRKVLDAGKVEAEAEQVAASLERQSNQTIAELENIQKAEAAAAKTAEETKAVEKVAETATDVPKSDPVHMEPTTVTPTPAKPTTTEPVPAPTKPEPIIENPMENLNEATSKMLAKPENKALKAALEANPRAARALKLCKSPCWPEFATDAQIARIEKIIAEGEEIGSVNYARLRDALRNPSIQTVEDLDKAIAQLEHALEEQKALGAHIAGHQELAGQATHFDMSPDAVKLRATPGVAEGGKSLTRQGFPWLIQGKAGLFPKQIADKMRNMSFKNFDEFREVFWRLVAADEELGKAATKANPRGWSQQNLALMRQGKAPYVSAREATGGGSNAVWQIDHKLALKNQGEVYNFDNLQIVSPKFHVAVGEK